MITDPAGLVLGGVLLGFVCGYLLRRKQEQLEGLEDV